MFEFFEWIVDLAQSIWDFWVSNWTGFFRLLKLLPSAVSTLTDAVSHVPDLLSVFATVTITVSVIFLLVGREGGGQK